mmetsp:Transcript_8081/g.12073  ORF Transcript_8081/g.12073 Transcript_8081/m.12073 type:complete len:80 (+) Transcript_8081:221-460(+)
MLEIGYAVFKVEYFKTTEATETHKVQVEEAPEDRKAEAEKEARKAWRKLKATEKAAYNEQASVAVNSASEGELPNDQLL